MMQFASLLAEGRKLCNQSIVNDRHPVPACNLPSRFNAIHVSPFFAAFLSYTQRKDVRRSGPENWFVDH
jgi:hypothetical protein